MVVSRLRPPSTESPQTPVTRQRGNVRGGFVCTPHGVADGRSMRRVGNRLLGGARDSVLSRARAGIRRHDGRRCGGGWCAARISSAQLRNIKFCEAQSDHRLQSAAKLGTLMTSRSLLSVADELFGPNICIYLCEFKA